MIQPIALMKPGTITTTAIMVIKAFRHGSVVRFNNHAKGKAKIVATSAVPNPTINVFGMTWVNILERATRFQLSRV